MGCLGTFILGDLRQGKEGVHLVKPELREAVCVDRELRAKCGRESRARECL